MICPACGRENRAGAGYCAWCGAQMAPDVAGEAPSEVAPQAPSPEEGSSIPGEEARVQAAGPSTPARREAPEPPIAPEVSLPVEERASQPQGEIQQPPAVQIESPVEPRPEPQPAKVEAAPASERAVRPTPSPLLPGDLLGGSAASSTGRYRVEKLLESGPDQNVYSAIDLARCRSCGYEGNTSDDAYCQQCGALLEPRPRATITEQVRRAPDRFDMHFSEGERDYYVTGEPEPPVEEVARASAMRLQWGRATDQGLQRDHNEDYLEAWLYARGSGGSLGLFVVADGLGGQDSGEVASQMATEAVWEALRPTVWEPIIRGETMGPDELEEKLAQAVLAANQAVYDARMGRNSEMSTTLTLALVVNDAAHIANVGDSRTYLWNAEGLRGITRDHSLVQGLVDAGQITPDQVYTHPQRNLFYQSVGDRPEVQVDIFRHRLSPDDRLVLCSDGLWEMVRDEGLEEVLLAEPDPQRAADRLVRDANLAGGEDNISVIVVRAVGS